MRAGPRPAACAPAILLPLLCALLLCGPGPAAAARSEPALRLVGRIPLERVEGRIDHIAVDERRRLLFVAALGNNTVEVVDLGAGRRVESIEGFARPQGVCFVPEPDRLFVANGESGRCDVLDAATFRRVSSVRCGTDADNVRYDPAARRVYVGFGEGALAAIDARGGDIVSSAPLPGHPESFELEPAGRRAFVNVPSANRIVVVDRAAGRVLASWPLGTYRENYPMALDAAGRRLFVGCRRPGAILVYDTRSGSRIAAVTTCGDVDDLSYDARRAALYASCGSAELDVFADRGAGLAIVERVPTASGARTSLYVPALDRLYVAAPHRDTSPAEILVFEPGGPARR